MSNFGKNRFCLLVWHHRRGIYWRTAGCRFDAYKCAMNYVAIVGSLPIKIFVAQGRDAAGWAGAIGHRKCNGMVKVDNHLVLAVTNLGTIVGMMLAIPALLCDWVGVAFPWRWNNLFFDPETKDLIHFSQIDEQVPYWSHATVIYRVISNDKNLAAILQFVEQIFTTFWITDCLGGGLPALNIVHHGEG